MAIAAMAITFVVTLIVGKFLIPELRKLHAGQSIREDGPTWHAAKEGTPTMGGIMFILGVGVVILILGWKQMLQGSFAHLYVYLFALVFGLIGFVDDYRKVARHQNEGLTARQKFLMQLAAAVVFLCLMRYEGMLTDKLYFPFFNTSVHVNWIAYLIFAAFVIVGAVNAVNLTDGVDGLACSVTFVVMAFFTVTALLWKTATLPLMPAALMGGLGAFFVYNHHPAKVFMGDTGSLFLGGAVAALAFAMDMPLGSDSGGNRIHSGDSVRYYTGRIFQSHPRQALFQDGAAAPPSGAVRLERGENCHRIFRADAGLQRAGAVGACGEDINFTQTGKVVRA
jgi:phospho-N-acetylmuramoyl-pentapeptide-transferase